MKYFDYASTTPPDENILKTMIDVDLKFYRKPDTSIESEELKEEIEKKVLEILKFDNSFETILTSSGTEANNIAILGKFKYQKEKKHIITSSFEHSSVKESCEELERRGHEVSYIKPNKDGFIQAEDVVNAIKSNTSLVTIMHVNNEIGTIQDIEMIFEKVKEKKDNITTMTDAIQGLGKTKLPQKYTDMLTLSAHKIYGPKGVGALIKKKNIDISPVIFGGNSSFTPGTYSLGSRVAFLKALKNTAENFQKYVDETNTIKKYFVDKIKNHPQVEFNGSLNPEKSVNILSLTLDIEAFGPTVVEHFEEQGLIISTRSACSQKSNTLSHVLQSIDLEPYKIERTIRISFSHLNKKEDVDYLYDNLIYVLDNF